MVPLVATRSEIRNLKILIEQVAGEVLAGMANFYDHLAREGKDVTYYSNNIDSGDKYAVLMHWKLPDGKYRVIFGDLRPGTVSSEVLIILQARMLQ